MQLVKFGGFLVMAFSLLGNVLASRASAETAPAASEIVRAIIESKDVPLSVDPSCASAAIEPSAKTIGDYFSQLVAALQDERFAGLKMSIESKRGISAGKQADWECAVFFTVSDAHSPWKYGLTFQLRGSPRRAIPSSFRCPGGA